MPPQPCCRRVAHAWPGLPEPALVLASLLVLLVLAVLLVPMLARALLPPHVPLCAQRLWAWASIRRRTRWQLAGAHTFSKLSEQHTHH